MGNNGKSQYRSRDLRHMEAGQASFSEPIIDVDTVLAKDRNTSTVEEAVVENVRSIEPQQVHANNKTTGELVDNLLIKVFGDSDKVRSALKEGEEHVFTHLQNYGMSEAILMLRLKQEKEHPEFRDELERLESDAQEKLKSLDQAPEFSRDKLRDLLIEYRKNLASLLANNNNNMSNQEEQITSPSVERVEPTEASAEVAAEIAEQINQAAEEVAAVVPEVKPEIKKLVDDSQNGIKEILSASGSSPLGYAESELDKITKPKTKVELNSEKVDSGSKIENIKHLIKKLNDAFVAPDTDGYTARRKTLQEVDDLIGTKQYQDIVLSHSKDKELLMNEAIERAVKELEDMLRNEELRLKTKELRDLIKQLETSFVAPGVDGYHVKQKALGEAARILGDQAYLVILNHDKDGGMSVNAAIEKAILEAEARIRAFDSSDNKSSQKKEAQPDSSAAKTADASDPTSENLTADSQEVPAIPKGPEGPTPEADPVLAKNRGDFWTAYRKRGNFLSKGRNLGFTAQTKEQLAEYDKIKEGYDKGVADKKQAILLEFRDKLDPSLSEVEKKAKVLAKHMELYRDEEKAIDDISTQEEVAAFGRFKTFWKKTGIHRLILGIGMFATAYKGVDLVAKAASIGMGPAFIAAMVTMSSTGTYMAAEGLLDTRTEMLGQKGLIDELKNIGFQKKKKGGEELITMEDKKAAVKLLMSDEYPLEVLEKEHSRLRSLSFDKRKGIKEAGRFGTEQTLMIEAVEEAYAYKKAKAFVESLATAKTPEEAKAQSLSTLLSQEKQATLEATSEQDKSRTKAWIRHSLSALLGLGAGWLTLNRLIDKLNVKPETTTPDPTKPEVVEIPKTVTVPGDKLWNLLADQAEQKLPYWNSLNEAQQTVIINVLENKFLPEASHWGVIGDVNHLQAGMEIDMQGFMDAEATKEVLGEGIARAASLSSEATQNILDNNDALDLAASRGVDITDINVDDVIKEYRPIMEAHEVGEQAVTAGIAENTQDIATGVESESVVDIAGGTETSDSAGGIETTDAADTDIHENVLDNARNQAEWAKNEYSQFVHGTGEYSNAVYKIVNEVKDTGAVNDVVNKVFESSAEIQQQFLHDLSPEIFTTENNKAEVFLKVLQESTKLPQIDSLGQLEKMIDAFDSLADSTALPGKEFAPRILNVDGADEPVYVLAKKVGGKVLGLFGEPKYMIDYLGPEPLVVSEQVMLGYLNPRV